LENDGLEFSRNLALFHALLVDHADFFWLHVRLAELVPVLLPA
jgi:hypothetical protein